MTHADTDALHAYLGSLQSDTVDFFQPHGNFGDALIWEGTKSLLRQNSIRWRLVQPGDQPTSSTLLIGGGGNLVDLYSDVRDMLTTSVACYREIAVLPHTINGKKTRSLLESLPTHVRFFCRELLSFEFVRGTLSGRTNLVDLAHDCAFNIDVSPHLRLGEGTLNAFRIDCEATNVTLPEGNIDISTQGGSFDDTGRLLARIARFQLVRTNRLHIAIAGAMLGKDVELFANSYYKNRAVYDFSLARFRNVVWSS